VPLSINLQKAATVVQFDINRFADLNPLTQRPSRASMTILGLVAAIAAIAAGIYCWLN
jgi:hypothetical protein